MTGKNIVLLLTATIDPGGMTFTALQDAEIRKRQYLDAIAYYLDNTSYKIVFCENTGNDISQEITPSQRIEYLTFNGNNYDKSIGKSLGEALILQHAIRHSKFISNSDYIIKITGRVKITNLDKITKAVNKSIKGPFIALELARSDWANTICFCTKKTWLLNTIEANLKEMRHSKLFIETMIFRVLKDPNLSIFSIYPIIDGICAGFNKPYPNAGILYRKTNHYLTLSNIYKVRKDYLQMIKYVILGYMCRFFRIAQVLPLRIIGK